MACSEPASSGKSIENSPGNCERVSLLFQAAKRLHGLIVAEAAAEQAAIELATAFEIERPRMLTLKPFGGEAGPLASMALQFPGYQRIRHAAPAQPSGPCCFCSTMRT